MANQQALYADMEEILRLHGGVLNLPLPNHKHWCIDITKWLKVGLNLEFIEHVATNIEGQYWEPKRKAKAKSLDWEFRMEAHWRRKMDSNLQRLKDSVVFGDTGSHDWESAIVKCFELGFNVAFVEELEHCQKPYESWTATLRDRAKTLEWNFHRPILIEKYTKGAGKSIVTIVKEMLSEKGIKLSPNTLHRRLTEWGVIRTKLHAYSATQSTDLSTPTPARFAASVTPNIALPDQGTTVGYHESQLAPLGDLTRSSSSAQIVSCEGYSDPVQTFTGAEPLIGNPSGTPMSFHSYLDDIPIHDLSSNYLLASSHQDPLAGTTSSQLTGMSTQFLTNSTPYYGLLLDTNPGDKNLERMSEPNQLTGRLTAEDIEAKIQYLSSAIKAKEQALRGIESNYTAIDGELKELRNQLTRLSFDLRNLVGITHRN